MFSLMLTLQTQNGSVTMTTTFYCSTYVILVTLTTTTYYLINVISLLLTY